MNSHTVHVDSLNDHGIGQKLFRQNTEEEEESESYSSIRQLRSSKRLKGNLMEVSEELGYTEGYSKKRRVNVTTACANCQRFHTSCEAERPCKKCVEKGKTCSDGIARKRGRKKGSHLSSTNSRKQKSSGSSGSSVQIEPQEIPSSDYIPLFAGSPSTKQTLSAGSNWEDLEGFLNLSGSEEPVSSPESGISESGFSPDSPVDLDAFIRSLQAEEPQRLIEEPFYRGVPDKNETPSTFRSELLDRLIEMVSSRVPHKLYIMQIANGMRNHMDSVRENLSEEAYQSIWNEFNKQLSYFRSLFEDLGVPTVIWEKCGIIHYVNPSFKDLTGFSESLPTHCSNLSFYNLLSNDGLGSLLDKIISDLGSEKRKDTFSFPCGVKVTSTGTFVEGTMCITCKRDILGMPLLFVGNFLPSLL